MVNAATSDRLSCVRRTDLARLWMHQGSVLRRAMFSNPSWPFPQSFDTPDVKEAVLAQLQ